MIAATTPQPAPARLDDWQRVTIVWVIVLGSSAAYYFYPALVPVVLPGVVLLISRVFVRTQFPHLTRLVWFAFWLGQLLFLVGTGFVYSVRNVGVVFLSLGSIAILVWLAFIVASDAVLLRRSVRVGQTR